MNKREFHTVREGIGSDAYSIQWRVFESEQGLPVNPIGHSDFSVQVMGKFGFNGRLVLEGSDIENAEHYQPVLDVYGDPMIFASVDKRWIGKHHKFYRPRVKGGDRETNLTVVIFCCYDSSEKRELVETIKVVTAKAEQTIQEEII